MQPGDTAGIAYQSRKGGEKSSKIILRLIYQKYLGFGRRLGCCKEMQSM